MRATALSRFLLLSLALFVFASALAAGPLPRIAISLPADIRPAEAARVAQAFGAQDLLIVLPAVVVRIGEAGEISPPIDSAPDLPNRAYLHLRVEVADVAATGREREALVERQVTESVGRLGLDRPAVAGLVIEPVVSTGSADVLQFALATLMVKAKGARPGLEIALEMSGALDGQRLLAYVDSVILPSGPIGAAGVTDIGSAAAGRPLTLRVPIAGADDARGGSVALLDGLLAPGAAAFSTIWIDLPGLSALGGLCAARQFLARSLDGGFEMTAPERAPAGVLVEGRSASQAVAFVGSRSADVAVLLRAGGSRETPRALTLAAAAGKTPQVTCFDAVDGRILDARPGAAAACTADTDYVLFQARFPAGAERLFESVNVTGRTSLRVEEIIARWQAAREAERRVLDNYSVACFLVLHFEASTIATGIDVGLELQQFWDRSGVNDWVQTAFRVNGVKLRKGQEFPLPQLEPDKVVSKPLELRIEDKYTYELLGTDTVDGRVCYVVKIKPDEGAESLYSGKMWIDGVDFRQVRLLLEQRHGRNNVAAHVETQQFERVKDARGREFTMVRAIDTQDAVNLAGRLITLERRYRFGEYAINTDGFGGRLAAARASDDPMFRDTENGLRNLRKQGTERVVDPNVSKQIRALLGGVLYDGSRTYPVPLAGISWIDFDFRKTGQQFTAFFAGPIFAGNLSKQVNKQFRWGIDLSLNALPSTNYEYADDKEVPSARVQGFGEAVGGLLSFQPTPWLELSTQIDLLYDHFRAASETDPAYRIPSSGITFDVYGQAKFNRRGFSSTTAVEHGRRSGWTEYGPADDPAPFYPNWTRYFVETSQHLFVGKLTRGGVSAAYYGGRDLDRFSRYSPSFFGRPTINGLPNGADTFDEIITAGAYYGFNVMDMAKLQGDYTHAWTRNLDEGTGLRQFDGLNVSIGMAGPIGTFVQGSIAVALRGDLDRYPRRWGIYLVFLKPWKK